MNLTFWYKLVIKFGFGVIEYTHPWASPSVSISDNPSSLYNLYLFRATFWLASQYIPSLKWFVGSLVVICDIDREAGMGLPA